MAEVLSDIEWYRGDSYPIELTIKNSGVAVDITGYSFMLTVDTLKDPPDATTKVFDVAGVLDADPTTGKVSFTPTTLQTDFVNGSYYYDVQMTDASSNIKTIAKYKWTQRQDISK